MAEQFHYTASSKPLFQGWLKSHLRERGTEKAYADMVKKYGKKDADEAAFYRFKGDFQAFIKGGGAVRGTKPYGAARQALDVAAESAKDVGRAASTIPAKVKEGVATNIGAAKTIFAPSFLTEKEKKLPGVISTERILEKGALGLRDKRDWAEYADTPHLQAVAAAQPTVQASKTTEKKAGPRRTIVTTKTTPMKGGGKPLYRTQRLIPDPNTGRLVSVLGDLVTEADVKKARRILIARDVTETVAAIAPQMLLAPETLAPRAGAAGRVLLEGALGAGMGATEPVIRGVKEGKSAGEIYEEAKMPALVGASTGLGVRGVLEAAPYVRGALTLGKDVGKAAARGMGEGAASMAAKPLTVAEEMELGTKVAAGVKKEAVRRIVRTLPGTAQKRVEELGGELRTEAKARTGRGIQAVEEERNLHTQLGVKKQEALEAAKQKAAEVDAEIERQTGLYGKADDALTIYEKRNAARAVEVAKKDLDTHNAMAEPDFAAFHRRTPEDIEFDRAFTANLLKEVEAAAKLTGKNADEILSEIKSHVSAKGTRGMAGLVEDVAEGAGADPALLASKLPPGITLTDEQIKNAAAKTVRRVSRKAFAKMTPEERLAAKAERAILKEAKVVGEQLPISMVTGEKLPIAEAQRIVTEAGVPKYLTKGKKIVRAGALAAGVKAAGVKAAPIAGAPVYAAGESMEEENPRLAMWLKVLGIGGGIYGFGKLHKRIMVGRPLPPVEFARPVAPSAIGRVTPLSNRAVAITGSTPFGTIRRMAGKGRVGQALEGAEGEIGRVIQKADKVTGNLAAPFAKTIRKSKEGREYLDVADEVMALANQRKVEKRMEFQAREKLAALKKTNKEKYARLKDVMEGKRPADTPEEAEAAAALKGYFDDALARAQLLGSEVQGIPQYMPHPILRSVSNAIRLGLENNPTLLGIRKWADENGIENLWQDYESGIRSGGTGTPSSLKSRSLNLPETVEWKGKSYKVYETDPLFVLENHMDSMEPYLATLELHGADALAENGDITVRMRRAQAAHPDIAKKIENVHRETFGGGPAIEPITGDIGKTARNLQVVAKLPLSTIGNIMQLPQTLSRFGLKATGKALIATAQPLAKRMNNPHIRAVTTSGILANDGLRSQVGMSLAEGSLPVRLSGKAAQAVLDWNQFKPVDMANDAFSALTASFYYEDMVRVLAGKKPVAGYFKRVSKTGKLWNNEPVEVAKRAFRRAGLSDDRIAALAETGEIEQALSGRLLQDATRQTQFKELTKFDRPYIFNSDMMNLLLQFKRFISHYGNFALEEMKDVVTTGDIPKLATMAAGVLGAGAGAKWMRDTIYNREDLRPDDAGKLAFLLQYAGIMGIWGDLFTDRKGVGLEMMGPSVSDLMNVSKFVMSREPVVGAMETVGITPSIEKMGRYAGEGTGKAIGRLASDVSPLGRLAIKTAQDIGSPDLSAVRQFAGEVGRSQREQGDIAGAKATAAKKALIEAAAQSDADKRKASVAESFARLADTSDDVVHDVKESIRYGDALQGNIVDRARIVGDHLRGDKAAEFSESGIAYYRIVGHLLRDLVDGDLLSDSDAVDMLASLQKKAASQPERIEDEETRTLYREFLEEQARVAEEAYYE